MFPCWITAGAEPGAQVNLHVPAAASCSLVSELSCRAGRTPELPPTVKTPAGECLVLNGDSQGEQAPGLADPANPA